MRKIKNHKDFVISTKRGFRRSTTHNQLCLQYAYCCHTYATCLNQRNKNDLKCCSRIIDTYFQIKHSNCLLFSINCEIIWEPTKRCKIGTSLRGCRSRSGPKLFVSWIHDRQWAICMRSYWTLAARVHNIHPLRLPFYRWCDYFSAWLHTGSRKFLTSTSWQLLSFWCFYHSSAE